MCSFALSLTRVCWRLQEVYPFPSCSQYLRLLFAIDACRPPPEVMQVRCAVNLIAFVALVGSTVSGALLSVSCTRQAGASEAQAASFSPSTAKLLKHKMQAQSTAATGHLISSDRRG